MSFLVVGTKKGMYNQDELSKELKNWGAADPQEIIVEAVKKRKIQFAGYRILSLI